MARAVARPLSPPCQRRTTSRISIRLISSYAISPPGWRWSLVIRRAGSMILAIRRLYDSGDLPYTWLIVPGDLQGRALRRDGAAGAVRRRPADPSWVHWTAGSR